MEWANDEDIVRYNVGISGIRRLRRVAGWVRNRFATGVLILLYHRVAELDSDPHLLGVTPRHFAEHLEVLRRYGHPIHLMALAKSLRDGYVPHRAVVVTFDDGYADNLYNARPLLARYDVPATVFVTTGYIGCDHEFWWDELDRLLLQPGTLPETLRLSVNGRTYHWELGKAAYYSKEEVKRHRRWNVSLKDDANPRQQLYRSLCQLVRPLSAGERHKVLNELLAWTGAESMGRPTHRTLSADEVVQLMEGGLIEVGSHTVTHPVLSALPAPVQRAEIERSRDHLEELLEHPVTSFAYPYGTQLDYTRETVVIVQEVGFTCACSNFAGVVRWGCDQSELPRVHVRDCDGEEFSRRLDGWFRRCATR